MAVSRIVRLPEVTWRTGLSVRTLKRLETAGEFPPRKRISPNVVGWTDDEICNWIDSRPVKSSSMAAKAAKAASNVDKQSSSARTKRAIRKEPEVTYTMFDFTDR